MKTAIYIRTASKNESLLNKQRDLLKAYCKAHHHEIVTEFVDFGVHGRDMNRPALKALLDSGLEDIEWDTVLVTEPTRWSRNPYVRRDIRKEIGLYGIKTICTEENEDNSLKRLLKQKRYCLRFTVKQNKAPVHEAVSPEECYRHLCERMKAPAERKG